MPKMFDLVVDNVARALELESNFTCGPDTDLVSLSSLDPERLEDALEALQNRLALEWPHIPDEKGRLRRAQLFLPDKLIVSELCLILDSGKWPMAWTRSGKFYS